ncbi:MAG: RING finger domain-containing protein [Candidatus Hodarchaeota archaeon]
MTDKKSLKDEELEDETSNLRLLLYGQPQVTESRIYYSSQSTCYQQSIEFLNSLDNIEILRENGHSEIEYTWTNQDSKEPYWKGKLEVVTAETGNKIKFGFDFKDYFKQLIFQGLKGLFFVSIFFTIIIGSYEISNLFEPWFILTNVGLVGICILFLSVFLLDRSEACQQKFMKKISGFLDTSESELISLALEEFRSQYIKETVLKEHPKEVICFNCQTANKDDSSFCIKCGLALTGCSICLLKIGSSEEILRCPYCNSLAHKSHLLEWLKLKGVCPVCKNPLKWIDNKLS